MHRTGKVAVAVAAAAAIGVFVSSLAIGAPRPLPLSARVIRSGEFPGFVPAGTVLFRSVDAWISFRGAGLTARQAAAVVAAYRRDGFKVMLSENLDPAKGSDRGALSWVARFRSAAAAKAEIMTTTRLSAAIHKQRGRSYEAFQVYGFPGARGFHATRPGLAGDNIVFSDGPFLYLLGDSWVTGATNPPARARLVAAAMKLYKRVHGHPAP